MIDHVRVDQLAGGVVVLTLDRPAARNAMNVELAQALVDAVADHQDARCLVITGADPAFCAGLDLRALGTERLMDLPPFLHAVTSSAVPTIAAVNGAAVTGGFELALACDFIVASDRARFADTHLRVGVYPGPVLVELPRRIGMARAREMTLTGNFVDAATALRIGLANHVVPHEQLLEMALGLAGAIAEQDPHMVRVVRDDWNETGELPIVQARVRHQEIAAEHGYTSVDSSTLTERRAAVIARAHEQGGHQ